MSTSRQRVVTRDQWGKPDRNEAGAPVCRWCREPVKPPRRTFCGDACVHEWKIRSSPWYVRRQVKKRDKGVCRLCGFNVTKAHREWTRSKPPAGDRAVRQAWRALRPRWEADHIIPVADGGGECALENYRLLCRPCHVLVTLALPSERAAKKSRAERAAKKSRAERAAKTSRAERAAKTSRAERAAKTSRAQSAEKTSRVEKAGNTEAAAEQPSC